jgi:hypothetical protein
MSSIGTLAGILSLAIGSGINLYAAVLTVGVGIRMGWIRGLPAELDTLANTWVLVVAGVFYSAEFIADKIPFFTPVWDGIHTLIRPLGAAVLALGAASQLDPMLQVFAALGAGTVALGTHSTKMGARLVAHSTPDPVTHSVISIAEDFGVVGLLLLAYNYPWIALGVVIAILAVMAMVAPLLFRILRIGWNGFRGRLVSWTGSFEPEAEDWINAGSSAFTKAFARTCPGVRRLQAGYIVWDRQPRFVYRRWFRVQEKKLAPSAWSWSKGVIYNVAACGDTSFYITKEWCGTGSSARSASVSA